MSKNKSNVLLYGLRFGGTIIGAGIAIYYSSKAIMSSNRKKKERKHKFFEGIDDIFDESARMSPSLSLVMIANQRKK